jgi:hypothetical protein
MIPEWIECLERCRKNQFGEVPNLKKSEETCCVVMEALAERRKSRAGVLAYIGHSVDREVECCNCERSLKTRGTYSEGWLGGLWWLWGRPVFRPTSGPRLPTAILDGGPNISVRF